MKKRILRILAAPAALLTLPYSAITWIVNGRVTLSAKLLEFAMTGDA